MNHSTPTSAAPAPPVRRSHQEASEPVKSASLANAIAESRSESSPDALAPELRRRRSPEQKPASAPPTSRALKLLFINQYYWPDSAATAQMLTDLCQHLARHGHEVHVVASRGQYDAGSSKGLTPAYERHESVHIHRVRATGFGKRGFIAQATDFLSFHLLCVPHALKARNYDAIITLTTPPLVGLLGVMGRLLGKAKHVNWVMDLHPDVEFELGVFSRKKLVPRLLDAVNKFELRRAHVCVALGDYMRQRLRDKNIPDERIEVLPVWGHDHVHEDIDAAHNPLRAELGLQGKFVVMYSGNAGMIHTFDEVCAAALKLRDDPRIVFLFIGGGRRIQEIKQFQQQHNLANVRVMGYFPRERLNHSLTLADAHLITLRPGLAGVSIPCKLYGIMAARRPALFVGPDACETADAIRAADCGRVIPNGDADKLVATLQELAANPEIGQQLGANARRPFEQSYNAAVCCNKWRELLERRVGA